MNGRILDNAAFIAALFFLGIALGFMIGRMPEYNCPVEDSCTVDYHDGVWEVIQNSPEEYIP